MGKRVPRAAASAPPKVPAEALELAGADGRFWRHGIPPEDRVDLWEELQAQRQRYHELEVQWCAAAGMPFPRGANAWRVAIVKAKLSE